MCTRVGARICVSGYLRNCDVTAKHEGRNGEGRFGKKGCCEQGDHRVSNVEITGFTKHLYMYETSDRFSIAGETVVSHMEQRSDNTFAILAESPVAVCYFAGKYGRQQASYKLIRTIAEFEIDISFDIRGWQLNYRFPLNCALNH